MAHSLAGVRLPDPLHPQPWEEQDEPLASNRHFDEQTYCWHPLRYLLNPACHYVSMDRWLRMDPNDPSDRLLPDLLLARDLQDREWDNDEYLPWVVGKAPEVLAEFLSPSSVSADLVGKPKRYGALGVREYFVFDPDGSFGVPPLQGWELRADGKGPELPVVGGGIASRLLPIRFVLAEGHIGVVDARSGELALRYDALQRRLSQAIAAEQAAIAAQQAAEAEARRLRAELDRLRRGDGPEVG